MKQFIISESILTDMANRLVYWLRYTNESMRRGENETDTMFYRDIQSYEDSCRLFGIQFETERTPGDPMMMFVDPASAASFYTRLHFNGETFYI